MDKSRKDYVQHPEQIDESQTCFFCMDLCVDPVQCLGPCKSMSCRRCASEWCKNGRRQVSCPKKCITPWRFELIPHKKIHIVCPYSPTCSIEFVQDLEKHLQVCPFAPEEVKATNRLRNNYLCSNNHELKFYVGSFEEIVNSVCHECSEKGDCRTKCPKCHQTYCVRCRPPPCSKECCPLGHSYRFVKPARKSTICDMCGMSAGLVGLGVHSDPTCNFDVCEICYERLPVNNSQNEIVNRIRNLVSNHCTNKHELTVLVEPRMGVCKVCEKQKVCWKECTTCSDIYCLACKQPKCNRLVECQYRHKYELRPGAEQCMLCSQVSEHGHVLHDKDCKIVICIVCAERLVSIDSQSRRMKTYLYCDKNHVLGYNSSQFLGKCELCEQQKLLSMFCMECKPQRLYCQKCKRIDWKETCYFGDKLQRVEFSEENSARACDICQQTKTSDVWSCRYCKFDICESCRLS